VTSYELFIEAISGPFPKENTETQTEYRTEIKDRVLTIAFQGSTSYMDWRDNFRFLKTPYRNMDVKFRVHRGFLRKWKSVRDEIFQFLTNHRKEFDKILVLGYSQGAALALLCHEDVWYNFLEDNYMNLVTYAFACPRTFSWMVPEERFETAFVFNHKRDLVANVPFRLMGYRHLENTTWIGKKEWWQIIPKVKYHFISPYKKALIPIR